MSALCRTSLSIAPGDLVEVRNADEIMQTLDENGTLDALPFMPEMIECCGSRFRVARRVEKVCVEGANSGIREFRNNDVVLLEDLRCPGSHHGGCQRSCMLFWKVAWLRRVAASDAGSDSHCTTAKVAPAQCASLLRTHAGPDHFVCQSTELGSATRPLSRKQRVWKCWREVYTGNTSVRQMLLRIIAPVCRKLSARLTGRHPVGERSRTPADALQLQPGDWVQVKSLREIVATLDPRGRNRGLPFGFDMTPFCGHTFRVKTRLDKMIVEATGKLRSVENTVILDGVTCPCHYVIGGCPRQECIYWREIWLRKVNKTR